jgi:hypothetical protein
MFYIYFHSSVLWLHLGSFRTTLIKRLVQIMNPPLFQASSQPGEDSSHSLLKVRWIRIETLKLSGASVNKLNVSRYNHYAMELFLFLTVATLTWKITLPTHPPICQDMFPMAAMTHLLWFIIRVSSFLMFKFNVPSSCYVYNIQGYI